MRISKEAFILSNKICEQSNPAIDSDAIGNLQDKIDNLLAVKAFNIQEKCNSTMYVLEIKWLIKAILESLDITKIYPAEMIIDNYFWRIGTLDQHPLYFSRRVYWGDNFAKMIKILEERNSEAKSIILTSSVLPDNYRNLPNDNKITSLRNCLVHDNDNVIIDRSMIKPVLLASGFSTGYRSAIIKGREYKFTKSQAAIIEILHKSATEIHKHELMIAANSEQDDPKYIFRNKGKYHDAWGEIIKFDSQGYYWLEC